jgi:hypothetical protein
MAADQNEAGGANRRGSGAAADIRTESKEEIAATLERAATRPNQTVDGLADEGRDAASGTA